MQGLEALQKPLPGANGSEPPCASESVAGGDMTAFNGLGGVAATAMQSRAHMARARDDRGLGFYVRMVLVRDDYLWDHARACERLPKKRLRTGPVAFVPQQHINDLPVLVAA